VKAQDLPFTQLIEGSKQFVIPIFQRTYSWEESNCRQLWEDIVRVGSNPDLNSHFIGSAVYIPEADVGASIPRWLVIDGQQRITTMTLLLLAFMRRLEVEGIDKPISAAELEDYYLRNRYGKGDAAYRLLLTQTDKQTLIALLEGKEPEAGASTRIVENFRFFSDCIAGADLDVVWQGIKKLMIVDVRLQQGIDNPQMIFESMNSTGKALTQADLIRNFVLMGLKHELQTRLYLEYWRPMEILFGSDHYSSNFDDFMRYYLVVHTGDYKIRKGDIYDEFKGYSRKHEVETLLGSLKEFADYYCRIALGRESDPIIGEALHDIRELRADVCYPLLMEVYHDFRSDLLSRDEFLEFLRLVESYVFRRAICEIPTNSLRQTFGTFSRRLKKDRYLESAKAVFLQLPSYRRFPGDEEFIRLMQTRNLYAFNRRSYWLRRFENHGRKERVPVQDYTIEHIMPQNEKLSKAWQEELGPDWKRVHQTYLHTLGNLTLTGYNSEYSDRPFAEKRDMEGGFKHSPLKLNEGLGASDLWNESAIQQRAERLASTAAKIWVFADLPEEILGAYRAEEPEEVAPGYSLSDHPHLQSGITRELYDALRSEVLALDECVHEEILKLYIAFKAETNFVDVVPQAKRLRLSLNVPFAELNDPRGIAKDVSGLGRWGNGDVEVRFETPADLPYVLGLVRQALERQLGDEEEAG
jgi:uncharacterized protein with ParB-like and HNH nuclease domain/predicted transport protein